MHQKVVVVVLPSPYKPISCWKCAHPIATLSPLCPSCKALQSFPVSGVDYFSIFGLTDSLAIDEETLRARFYELSKQTHPDRYINVPPPEPLYASYWSSALNKAYQTLKDEKKRLEYLLELYQVPPATKSKVPLELAESYFEMQDLLLEDDAEQKMKEFKLGLIKQIEQVTHERNALAKEWNAGTDKEGLLGKLSDLLNRQRYLHSMLSDLERRIGGTSGNRWN